jgi:hypothetical protein
MNWFKLDWVADKYQLGWNVRQVPQADTAGDLTWIF